ncbi:DUF2073 domain-containing protein [Candidatus Woesearchaeota archaeon]|nr:DUF2073 domain-containing protein [Candidatus Woesearchaeota archaeon]MBW3014658.1 DUF2073 domain-containing protein [Candidatus Woesearchaeota archaeon]
MLTLQYVPFADIAGLDSDARVKKLLKLARDERIVLLEGKLKKEEEAYLIQKTMESIDESFKGIEIATINPDVKNQNALNMVRNMFVNILLRDRVGVTIIGPATIVKKIKQDPEKIQLLTKQARRKSGKRKK